MSLQICPAEQKFDVRATALGGNVHAIIGGKVGQWRPEQFLSETKNAQIIDLRSADVVWIFRIDEPGRIAVPETLSPECGRFVEEYRLAELLSEAKSALRNRFGDEPMTLNVVADPDEPDVRTLVLRLKTSKAYDEAVALWDDFSNKWWIPNYDRGNDALCILLDFQ